MNATRRLSLRKDTLVELTGAEAAMVAGALSGPTCLHATCNGGCNSDFQQCITGYGCVPTINDCVYLTQHACG